MSLEDNVKGRTSAFATFSPFKSFLKRLRSFFVYIGALQRDGDIRHLEFLHHALWSSISPRRLKQAGLTSKEVPSSGALLFMSAYNGETAAYFHGFTDNLAESMDELWKGCDDWPGAKSFDELAHFIDVYHRPTNAFFNAYRHSTKQIRTAMQIRSGVDQLLLAADGDATAFKEAYVHLTDELWGGEDKDTTPTLPLHDIQGNILQGYRLLQVTHLFGTIEKENVDAWRKFLQMLAPELTKASPWAKHEKPTTAVNLGLSYAAMILLRAEAAALEDHFPAFAEGMARRANVLGDDPNDMEWARWKRRHVWISVHGVDAAHVAERVAALTALAALAGIVGLEPMKAGAFEEGGVREHFGFRDGASNPVVAGGPRVNTSKLAGNGKLDAEGNWLPVATGEFLLGYANEHAANVVEQVAPLASLLKNGTFAVFRDLEQHVKEFHDYLNERAQACGTKAEFLAHKMMGRTKDGDPLTRPGSHNDFTYTGDEQGSRCPIGAHIRRARPRNTGDHLIIRRGLPYGAPLDPHSSNPQHDAATRRGLYFVAFNASIESQFEFVQRRWLNEPAGCLSDSNDVFTSAKGKHRMAIEGTEQHPPIVLVDIPSFVTCRGGEYYFVPGMEGLAWLAHHVPVSLVQGRAS